MKRNTQTISAPMPITIQTPRQPIEIAEVQREQRGDRPDAGAADEMHDRQDAAADRLRRIFAGVGERERLLGAEADAGDEARRRSASVTVGANAPRIVKMPNSSRLNW